MGNPFGRGTWGSFFHHAVDLFESEPLGFRHKEVSVEEAAYAEGAPQPEDMGAKVALISSDEVGSDDGDDLLRLFQLKLVKGYWEIIMYLKYIR